VAGSTRRCTSRPATRRSQGWTALIVDTNATASATRATNEPGPRGRLQQGHPHPVHFYGIAWSPRDGRCGVRISCTPGYICGWRPARTARHGLAEIYKIPLPGFGIRGMDVDRKAWSGAARQRSHRQLRPHAVQGPLNDPGAELATSARGLEFYPIPGPGFAGDAGAAENPYTRGSTSTIFWGLAPTCRSQPATSGLPICGQSRCRDPAAVCPYPMLFAQGLDGASMIPRVAGRRAASGHLGQSHAGGTSKASTRHTRRTRHVGEDAVRARWW